MVHERKWFMNTYQSCRLSEDMLERARRAFEFIKSYTGTVIIVDGWFLLSCINIGSLLLIHIDTVVSNNLHC